ncbi:Piso0_002300 [Millerozyma farinosa CBS 7064]|uniref:Piso0_002300 protein n=1 Tax=Pichia sorbitophila (strain ATCC MYA-4447 / BCRC 22081 / CBS 7064 / NBRC 10061 / NRRL Y-12695) TaxID=559304 RepID=G8YEN9_PICSO|nr:Piso0_002300 [Millerozyma farinosa CBS 7064]
MSHLSSLPKNILRNIIGFLPQQDVINLARTNFDFYEICMEKLYRRIIIRLEPILQPSNRDIRGIDYIDSKQTVVYGLKKALNREDQLKIINARIQVLILSLKINGGLLDYIEELTVYGRLDATTGSSVAELVSLFQGKSLKKLLITDYKLRRAIRNSLKLKAYQSLESVTIDKVSDFNHIDELPHLKEIIVAFNDQGSQPFDPSQLSHPELIASQLARIQILIITEDNQLHSEFIKLLRYLHEKHDLRLKLRTVCFNYYHGKDDVSVYSNFLTQTQIVDWTLVQNIEVRMGCDNVACNQECLGMLELSLPVLKKVSLVQHSEGEIDTHKYNEIWEVKVFSFLQELVDSGLKLISIRHKPASDGVFFDGMEGNYLQRLQLYTEMLPKILQNSRTTLLLPNLLKSLACYEQPMNTLLWNGCKCSHCELYLSKLDDFLMTHRYYRFKNHAFKDLVSSTLISAIAEALTMRHCTHDLMPDFDLLRYPFNDTRWDFHSNNFSIPFKCSVDKNYKEHEFDEDVEVFYDASDVFEACPFSSNMFRPVARAISHYVNDIVRTVISLSRGDAEDMEIGTSKDLNDGGAPNSFGILLLNGFYYHLDRETNGTNYFSNIYDA